MNLCEGHGCLRSRKFDVRRPCLGTRNHSGEFEAGRPFVNDNAKLIQEPLFPFLPSANLGTLITATSNKECISRETFQF